MCGDNGLVYDGYEMLDCDVAMMQGFLHDKSPKPLYKLT